MVIKYVDGHYEIVSADSGQFIQSADTWDEALDDMKELLQTAQGTTGDCPFTYQSLITKEKTL